MDYETIQVETDSGISVIRLNRPDVMNALNSVMRAEITHAVREAVSQARVLVITGNGRAFCSGQDLGDRVGTADLNLEATLREEYFPMLKAIAGCQIPTISAVNGAAAGAGANLALAADVVVAAESAFFMQAFSRIGLIPDAGGSWFLPRKIGLARAMGVAFFADRISARQAANWGMIWDSVPDMEFDGAWQGYADRLANGPTEAYRRIKQVMRASFDNDFNRQIELEARLQGEVGRTRDFREGVLAFSEKRPPEFEGR